MPGLSQHSFHCFYFILAIWFTQKFSFLFVTVAVDDYGFFCLEFQLTTQSKTDALGDADEHMYTNEKARSLQIRVNRASHQRLSASKRKRDVNLNLDSSQGS